MHKSATKCNETSSKWCKNKHGASKIIDTLEMYQGPEGTYAQSSAERTKDGGQQAISKRRGGISQQGNTQAKITSPSQ
jgi:hypothetical protein